MTEQDCQALQANLRRAATLKGKSGGGSILLPPTAEPPRPAWLVLKLNPMPAPRTNRNSRFNPAKAVLIARYVAWKREVLHLARCANWQPTPTLRVIFILPLPKSYSKRKVAELLGQPHILRPDTDNLTKALKDALYPLEDSGVWREDCEKRWGLTGEIRILRDGIPDTK